MSDVKAAYAALKDQANLAEAGGLAKERAVLLLWYLRTVMGVDDLEAYEFVCDGDEDGGIDGLMLEDADGESNVETLVIMQSKYPVAPNPVGRKAVEGLLAAADKFKTAEGLAAFLAGKVNDQVRSLVERFDLVAKLKRGDVASGKLRIRLVFVTAGVIDAEPKALIDGANAANGVGYFTAADINTLGPIAQSVMSPVALDRVIEFPSDPAQRLVLGVGTNRILITPIRATDAIKWAGIADRTLFDLNVRRELPHNLVRRQLDEAIKQKADHADFVAYHNGLTITCKTFETLPDRVRITGPSVVNGAQSMIAFSSSVGAGYLTDDLRVLVKIVETDGRPGLAEQVSRRSNTQNPVSPRNLVANTPRQRRMVAEFDKNYPAYFYETKPDTQVAAAAKGRTVIQNDDAAQLLCAVFQEEPWLAVKRNSLFEPENHPRIFGEDITPAQVILVHELAQLIEAKRDLFPELYRNSWRLTRLTAAYIVGQLLRASKEGSIERRVIDDPVWAVANLDQTKATLSKVVKHAAASFVVRHEAKSRAGGIDDFKVDFKRRDALLELRNTACDAYIYKLTVDAS